MSVRRDWALRGILIAAALFSFEAHADFISIVSASRTLHLEASAGTNTATPFDFATTALGAVHQPQVPIVQTSISTGEYTASGFAAGGNESYVGTDGLRGEGWSGSLSAVVTPASGGTAGSASASGISTYSVVFSVLADTDMRFTGDVDVVSGASIELTQLTPTGSRTLIEITNDNPVFTPLHFYLAAGGTYTLSASVERSITASADNRNVSEPPFGWEFNATFTAAPAPVPLPPSFLLLLSPLLLWGVVLFTVTPRS